MSPMEHVINRILIDHRAVLELGRLGELFCHHIWQIKPEYRKKCAIICDCHKPIIIFFKVGLKNLPQKLLNIKILKFLTNIIFFMN